MLKKLSIFLLVFFIALSLFSREPNHSTDSIDFAKALQMCLYFYEAEKCGSGQNNKLEWRGDCHTEDSLFPVSELEIPEEAIALMKKSVVDGKEYVDLGGGFHDAGDHVRFGLPQAYTLSTLAWGVFEFEEAYRQIGIYDRMIELLKWGLEPYFKGTVIDPDSGKVLAHCYMVGEGSVDHTYWGPPELQDPVICDRPADFATAETPASDMCAGASAALSIMGLVYQNSGAEDAVEYSEKCFTYAKALYEFAVENRGLGMGDGFYGSAYDQDELSWAALWLYEYTRDTSYIDQIVSYDSQGIYNGYLSKIISTTENTWQNIWVHCWDVVWGGVFTRLACIVDRDDFDYLTDKMRSELAYFGTWNMEYWSHIPHDNSSDQTYMKWTPQNYAMINTWGSARYNTAAQLCCLIYQKHQLDKGYNIEDKPFHLWSLDQMNYLFGDNKMDRVYMVGYNEKSVKNPHHRASHGSKKNSMVDPEVQRHTLWGALAGGPDGDDYHLDVTYDYVYNEVAIDYNAGITGALAGHYYFFQRESNPEPDAWAPLAEKKVDAYYAESKLEQENGERTQISITIHNESIHPPAFVDDLKARYYFDLAELYSAGQSVEDIKLEVYYDAAGAVKGSPGVKVNGPFAWNFEDGKRIFYYEFDWAGNSFYGDKEFQFGIIAGQDQAWKTHWDPTNDWSRQGVTDTIALNNNIPVYRGDEHVYGAHPPKGSTDEPSNGGETIPLTARVQYKCGETAASTSSIVPILSILKTGGTEKVSLSDLKLRYYFTVDALQGHEGGAVSPLTAEIDYAALGDVVKVEIVQVSDDGYYAELSFDSTDTFSGQTGQIKMRIFHSDYETFDQTDDYSFNAEAEEYVDFEKITLYLKDALLWGVEP